MSPCLPRPLPLFELHPKTPPGCAEDPGGHRPREPLPSRLEWTSAGFLEIPLETTRARRSSSRPDTCPPWSFSHRLPPHLTPSLLYPASSHHYYNTGTGHAHADVTGRQVRTLQSVFKRLSNGDIDRVEGDWKYQLGSGGNKVVTAKQWQEILANGFVWIDFCCIPQVRSSRALSD